MTTLEQSVRRIYNSTYVMVDFCRHQSLRYIGDQEDVEGKLHPMYQCSHPVLTCCGTSLLGSDKTKDRKIKYINGSVFYVSRGVRPGGI